MVNPVTPRWQADFPDDCPPAEATPADGIYYRIVKNDPPEAGDFVSLYRLDRRLAVLRIKRGTVTQCETMGLSVYADADDATYWAERLPKIGDKIARLVLAPSAGEILPTPREGNSHHTWWQAMDYDPTVTATVETPI